jgi:glucuronokinase
VILNIEKVELGISAGLQDRVIQTYGGLVHMDFSPTALAPAQAEVTGLSPYTPLDPALLPDLYLAYDLHAGKLHTISPVCDTRLYTCCLVRTVPGGDSGAVHNTVRARWEHQDPELVEGMTFLGSLADKAVECLQERRYADLAALMEQNFATRLRLYGPAVVGAKNVAMINLAKDLGLSAKFTGSGGALVCLRTDGSGL